MSRTKLLVATMLMMLLLTSLSIAQAPGSNKSTILLETDPPQPVSSFSVSAQVNGIAGTRTLYYWIVARYPIGNAIPSGPALVRSAPDTMTVGNFVRITWLGTNGALSYDVLRTITPNLPNNTCNCAVATASTTTIVNNTSDTLTAYTVTATQKATGFLALNNISYPQPRLTSNIPLHDLQIRNSFDASLATSTLPNEIVIGVPVGSCTTGETIQRSDISAIYTCIANTWLMSNSLPSGPSGGALTGTYPNPTLTGLPTVNAIPKVASAGVLGESAATDVNNVFNIPEALRVTGKATSVLTGSIDPTASTAVVGVGTLFTTELIAGDRITVNGETRTVTVITNATNLTVNTAFTDTGQDLSPDKLAALLVVRDSGGAIKVVVNDLGNIGSGTTSPSEKLDINGGRVKITGSSATWADMTSLELNDTFNSSSVRRWAILNGNDVAGTLAFRVGTTQTGNPLSSGATKMVIDNTGNVGLRTTTPTALLDASSGGGKFGSLAMQPVATPVITSVTPSANNGVTCTYVLVAYLANNVTATAASAAVHGGWADELQQQYGCLDSTRWCKLLPVEPYCGRHDTGTHHRDGGVG